MTDGIGELLGKEVLRRRQLELAASNVEAKTAKFTYVDGGSLVLFDSGTQYSKRYINETFIVGQSLVGSSYKYDSDNSFDLGTHSDTSIGYDDNLHLLEISQGSEFAGSGGSVWVVKQTITLNETAGVDRVNEPVKVDLTGLAYSGSTGKYEDVRITNDSDVELTSQVYSGTMLAFPATVSSGASVEYSIYSKNGGAVKPSDAEYTPALDWSEAGGINQTIIEHYLSGNIYNFAGWNVSGVGPADWTTWGPPRDYERQINGGGWSSYGSGNVTLLESGPFLYKFQIEVGESEAVWFEEHYKDYPVIWKKFTTLSNDKEDVYCAGETTSALLTDGDNKVASEIHGQAPSNSNQNQNWTANAVDVSNGFCWVGNFNPTNSGGVIKIARLSDVDKWYTNDEDHNASVRLELLSAGNKEYWKCYVPSYAGALFSGQAPNWCVKVANPISVSVGDAVSGYETDGNWTSDIFYYPYSIVPEGRAGSDIFARWTFNGSPTDYVVDDSSSYGTNDGSDFGTTYLDTAGFNGEGCYGFEETGTWIEVFNIYFEPTLDVDTDDFTATAWVKTSSKTGSPAIVSKVQSFSNLGYAMYIDGSTGKLGAYIGNNGGIHLWSDFNDSSDLTDNTWYHVAVTFDRDGDMIGYVNGSEVGTYDISSLENQAINNWIPFVIGAQSFMAISGNPQGYTPGSQWFSGLIDEVRFYKRVLTNGEIKSLYGQVRNHLGSGCWKNLYSTYSTGTMAGSSLTFDILDATDNSTIAGFTGISGDQLPMDISAVPSGLKDIKVRANFDTFGASGTPNVSDLVVEWKPNLIGDHRSNAELIGDEVN